MNKKKFNILITINSGYAKYAVVMLTSLFENNQECFHIYCLYSELDESNRMLLAETVEKYHNKIRFIQVDKSVYEDFPTTQNLTVECYFILLAHKLLSQNMDRILYLDSDVIIDGKIDELYNMEFDNQYMIVAGQSYRRIQGNYYWIGARPEDGNCFNSGVILFNLPKFRENIDARTYLEAAKKSEYHFELADQGILNIVFADKAKYVDTLKWNFRISMYEDYVKEGNTKLNAHPAIIHYVMRDYYRMGYAHKPWQLILNHNEYVFLLFMGVITKRYELQKADEMNIWMQKKWWDYARKTKLYYALKTEMEKEKRRILQRVIAGLSQTFYAYQKNIRLMKNITQKCFNSSMETYGNIKYDVLEKYIDSLEASKAIITMQNLFRWNCSILRKKENIRVAFIVYSSAEWQCEELYRMFESDERFEPIIIICGYGHGTNETIKDTYINTCKYFRNAEKSYNVEYMGYCNRYFENKIIDKFHILIYVLPFNGLYPWEINFLNRNITQLCIFIPYGCAVEDRKDSEIWYYEKALFKLSWFYFCYCELDRKIICEHQRLRGYNVKASGMPKLDSLLYHTYEVRRNIWKNGEKSAIKVIWAPHHNLRKGMNGTFYDNYAWFYEFAKEHQEISWIVRPHPRLEAGALQEGIFKNETEYRQYLEKWEALPNAAVVEGGDYYDIFETSDAMILDSLSFLVEYQYTGKPLLWLEAENPRPFNELGEKLLSTLYKAKSNNFSEIQNFIENMKNGVDPRKTEREEFRKQFLECREDMSKSPTKFIYDMVTEGIFKL